MIIPKKKFSSLLVLTVADLLQQQPVREKLIFSRFPDKDNKAFIGLAVMTLI